MFADAFVASGIAFFTTFGGLIYNSAATQTPIHYEVVAIAGIAASGTAFFLSLQASRRRAAREPRRRRRRKEGQK